MIRKHFRLKRIALGLAFAAFAAPSAQAMVAIDGPTGGEQAYQVQTVKASQLGQLDPWAYAAIHASRSGSTAAGTAIANARPASTLVTTTRTDNGRHDVAGRLAEPQDQGPFTVLARSSSGFSYPRISDELGHFQFAELPPDRYEVRLELPGGDVVIAPITLD